MKRIALLGAESTGKTQLATGLAAGLRARGVNAVAVPEALRAWCERERRAPRPQEQLAIAQEQERLVDQAAAGADLVVADTTALMVLVYSGMLFKDGDLYRFALARQQAYHATLLMGLDLPWVPDGLQRDAAQPREPVDALLRSLLQRAAVPFQVVYGTGPLRLQGALLALAAAGVVPAAITASNAAREAQRPWVWACEKCSDPSCEHRLFSQLQQGRG